MKVFLGGAGAAIVAIFAVALAVILSGSYNVAAVDRHWPMVAQVIQAARLRSIQVHAARIGVPEGLDSSETVVMGTEHYATHCAMCHGAPGVPKGELAEGLYPTPPDLAVSAKTYRPAELFWILRNGIKMTGMPAWSDHGEDELWAIVAFLQKLPGMTEEDYATLVQATMAGSGHHQHSDP